MDGGSAQAGRTGRESGVDGFCGQAWEGDGGYDRERADDEGSCVDHVDWRSGCAEQWGLY